MYIKKTRARALTYRAGRYFSFSTSRRRIAKPSEQPRLSNEQPHASKERERYGNLGLILNLNLTMSDIFPSSIPPAHAVWRPRLSARAYRVLICACTSMVCPIPAFRHERDDADVPGRRPGSGVPFLLGHNFRAGRDPNGGKPIPRRNVYCGSETGGGYSGVINKRATRGRISTGRHFRIINRRHQRTLCLKQGVLQ